MNLLEKYFFQKAYTDITRELLPRSSNDKSRGDDKLLFSHLVPVALLDDPSLCFAFLEVL